MRVTPIFQNLAVTPSDANWFSVSDHERHQGNQSRENCEYRFIRTYDSTQRKQLGHLKRYSQSVRH